MKVGDLPIVVEQNRIHLNPIARSDYTRSATVNFHPPQMTPVNVILVSRKNDEGFVLGKGNVFDFEIAWRQSRQRAAVSGNGVKVHPSIFLGRKDQPVACGPLPEIIRAQSGI